MAESVLKIEVEVEVFDEELDTVWLLYVLIIRF